MRPPLLLTSMTIPNSVHTIGFYVFFDCSSLRSIDIQDSVQIIKDYAFGNCISLTSIVIPGSVTDLGIIFDGCSELVSVTYCGIADCTREDVLSSASVNSVLVRDNYFGTTLGGKAVTKDQNCACPAYSPPDSGSTEDAKLCRTADGYPLVGAVLEWNDNGFIFDLASDAASFGIRKGSTCPTGVVTMPSTVSTDWGDCTDIPVTYSGRVPINGEPGFGGCSDITEVIFSDSITEIQFGSFQYCTSLSLIRFPPKLKSIHDNSFHSCTSLKSIRLPATLKTIYAMSFWKCSALESVSFCGMCDVSGCGACFGLCSLLTVVEVALDYIGDYFYEKPVVKVDLDCAGYDRPLYDLSGKGTCKMGNGDSLVGTNLRWVDGDIGFHLSDDACSFTVGWAGTGHGVDIVLPDTITTGWGDCSNIPITGLYAGDGNIGFARNEALQSIVFSNGISIIPSFSFYGCYELKEITFPATLTSIESEAFAYLDNLERLIFLSGTVQYIDQFAFGHSMMLYRLEFIACCGNYSPLGAFYLEINTEVLVSPNYREETLNGIAVTRNDPRLYCNVIDEVQPTETIDVDPSSGFDETSGIIPDTSVHICMNSHGLDYVDGEEFDAAESVWKYRLANERTEFTVIGGRTCPTGLVTIPSDYTVDSNCKNIPVTTIASSSFVRCIEIVQVKLNENMRDIEKHAFKGCLSLQYVAFPDTLTTIGDYAFAVTGLQIVILPSGILRLVDSVFWRCLQLHTVIIKGDLRAA